MNKIILALAATLALSSCNNDTSSDGYYFEKGTVRLSPGREIKVVLYPSLPAVNSAFEQRPNARKLGQNEQLQAFSVINAKSCTIHMVDPAVKYQPEFVGHELIHCLYGEFHPSQNER